MDKILIIDDEFNIRSSFKRILTSKERTILEAGTAHQGLAAVKSSGADLIILDLKLPDIPGLEVLKQLRQIDPRLTVIVVTAYGTTDTAIEAMKHGAYDYLLKPFDPPVIEKMVSEALHARKLTQSAINSEKNSEKNKVKAEDYTEDKIVGRSQVIHEIYKVVGQIATRGVPVLLIGESGTGKELVARVLHRHSERADKMFFPINCAAIPETLLESELFGYEKGAFTSADRTSIGKFEQCHGGTIFLDEIGDMSLSTQSKILRVLQNQEIQRLGGKDLIKVDVRIVAATNIDLEKAVLERRFREDLYYRINVVMIIVPPLRQRRDDIPDLVNYFFNKYRLSLNPNMIGFAEETINILKEYDWPGNVRELENTIRQGLVLGKGQVLLPQYLPPYIVMNQSRSDRTREAQEAREAKEFETSAVSDTSTSETSSTSVSESSELNLEDRQSQIIKDFVEKQLASNQKPPNLHSQMIALVEQLLVEEVLRRTDGNRSQASELLGITPPTLRKLITQYRKDGET